MHTYSTMSSLPTALSCSSVRGGAWRASSPMLDRPLAGPQAGLLQVTSLLSVSGSVGHVRSRVSISQRCPEPSYGDGGRGWGGVGGGGGVVNMSHLGLSSLSPYTALPYGTLHWLLLSGAGPGSHCVCACIPTRMHAPDIPIFCFDSLC